MMKKIGAGIGVLGMIIILIKIVSDAKDKKAASVNIIGGAVTTGYARAQGAWFLDENG